MVLLYKAATQEGKIVHGLIEAKDAAEAASYLRGHQLLPITIEQQKDNPLNVLLTFHSKFNRSDLVFFTRQIASMLTSGLTLMESLHVLKKQIKKEAVSDLIDKIISDIEGGSTFSQAIASYPGVFSSIYISLIKAGETSGLLDKVMVRLADNLEKEQKLRSQIRGALLYPVIIIIMMFVVVFVMMIFVIPQLNVLYESLTIELPFSTQVLIGLSNFTISFWPIIIGAIFGSMFIVRRWYKTSTGRKRIDAALLRLPIFGRIIQFQILTEVSRTFGLLIGSGEPIVDSLNQIKQITGNMLYENAVGRIAMQVEKGVSIGDAFNASPLFPPLLIQMIRVGEQTGKLDENLGRAGEYFEGEVEQSVRTLTTAIEPIIMAVLGLGVAFLLLAVITPLYKITSSF